MITKQTTWQQIDRITLFESEIHSVMPSPLVEKLHNAVFDNKLNHNPSCTESLIQITLGIYGADVRGGIYFISTCCTCSSLINNRVPVGLQTWNLKCSFPMVNLAHIPVFIALLLIVFALVGLTNNSTTCNQTCSKNVTAPKLGVCYQWYVIISHTKFGGSTTAYSKVAILPGKMLTCL